MTNTKNGYDRLVIMAAPEYERMKRRDRQVIAAGELTDVDRALIAKSQVPQEYAHLDDELKDWQP